MEKIAVFPGSFDPVTKGHESVIRRSLPLFDRLIIAIGENSRKTCLFPLEQRIGWLQEIFSGEPRISVAAYQGLTIDFCRREGARYILRGLRSTADFEFEQNIGQMNRMMLPEIETIFLLCDPEYAAISSSVVREIIRHGGDYSKFVPEQVRLDH